VTDQGQEPEQLTLEEDPAEPLEGWGGEKGRDQRRIHGGMQRIGELVADQQLLLEQRRSGVDPVVELPDGRICWASELTTEEIQAKRAIMRTDLTAPPGREHEGPPGDLELVDLHGHQAQAQQQDEDLDEDGQPYPF
jgi:hypothetical protein